MISLWTFVFALVPCFLFCALPVIILPPPVLFSWTLDIRLAIDFASVFMALFGLILGLLGLLPGTRWSVRILVRTFSEQGEAYRIVSAVRCGMRGFRILP